MFCQPMKWQWRCLRKNPRLLTYLPEEMLPLSINPIPAFRLVYFTECCNTGLFKLVWYKVHFTLSIYFQTLTSLLDIYEKTFVVLFSILHFNSFWRQSRLRAKCHCLPLIGGWEGDVLYTSPSLTLHFLYIILCIVGIYCPGYIQEEWIKYSGWVNSV